MAVATPLIGRVEELARLDGALKNLSGDSWSAVEVVGKAGIGKTRLLDELTRRADRRGALVLAGSASELERDLPFWVFVNALDDYIRSLDPRVLELLNAEYRAELAQSFPRWPDSVVAVTHHSRYKRYRTHRAVRGLLERLAATRPLVLSSTTSTGPTRRPSSCSVDCSAGPRTRGCWSRSPFARPPPEWSLPRSSGRTERRRSPTSRSAP